MNIRDTITSLDIDELKRLLTLSQGDKSSDAFRGTLNILDHADLVTILTERAKANPEFNERLMVLLQEDPLFIDHILESTSEAVQMLLKGEELDGTARLVMKAIKRNPELKRSFRKIYYIVRDTEVLGRYSHYKEFDNLLKKKGTEYVVGTTFSKYFYTLFSVFFMLILSSRLGTMNHELLLDYLGSTMIAATGGVLGGGVSTMFLGGWTISEEKVTKRVQLVSNAIWDFLVQLDTNATKEHESPEVEGAHKPPISLMDVLDDEESGRNMDDEGDILGSLES